MAAEPRLILVLLIGFGSVSPGHVSFSQSPVYAFRHIDSRQGLASDDVSSITQDDQGYMWFGTHNGLQRYDGYSFTDFHNDPADSQSISGDGIDYLLKDGKKGLWLLTSGGIDRFDMQTGKSIRIDLSADPALKALVNPVCVCRDEHGNAWFISYNSLARYDERTHRMISYDRLVPKGGGNYFTRIIQSDPRNHCLWINSAHYGICRFDPTQDSFTYALNNPRKLPYLSIPHNAGTIFVDRENHLWISTYNSELLCFDLATGAAKMYQPDALGSLRGAPVNAASLKTWESRPPRKRRGISVDCIFQDREGTLWIGARNFGLLQYCPQADSFRMIKHNLADPASLDYNFGVRFLFEDRESNIWVATDKGINIFNPYVRPFLSIPEEGIQNPEAPRHSFMSFLEVGKGDILAAIYGAGLGLYDRQFHLKKSFAYDAADPHALKDPGNHPWCFMHRPDGMIAIGSQGGWLSAFDPVSEKMTGSYQPPELGKNSIMKMVSDHDHNIWMTLYSGIAKWDARTRALIHYDDYLGYQSFSHSQSDDIFVDRDGKLWVATLTLGLQKFDPVKGHFTAVYAPDKKNLHSLNSATIASLVSIDDSTLALATSGGLGLFNKYSGRYSPIRVPAGLPFHTVSSLYFQAPDQLWEATPQGLYRLSLASGRVTSYGPEDGLMDNDFADGIGFYKMQDGRVLIGCRGGFICFDPDKVGDRPAPAAVRITGCAIDGDAIPLDTILRRANTMSLSYKENYISFQYASLGYRDPDGVSYYYRLDGVDRGWVQAGKQRFASYSSLAPGKYTFSVTCRNRDSVACASVTDLMFIIHPPFWLTWWFKTLVLIAIGLILYGIYLYRIGQIMAMQAIRNRISRDIHDDVGATLSSISILSEMARNNMNQGQTEQSYSLLAKISNYSRETVEKMSDIIWSIKPSNDNIEHIISRLRYFASEACSAKGIRLEFQPDRKALGLTLTMEQTKNIYLICKEGINNAIKHAHCTWISVTFEVEGGLQVIVLDDGAGFDPQSEKMGNGLQNMNNRAKEIKGVLVIRSAPGNTRLQLQVPVN